MRSVKRRKALSRHSCWKINGLMRSKNKHRGGGELFGGIAYMRAQKETPTKKTCRCSDGLFVEQTDPDRALTLLARGGYLVFLQHAC